MNPDEIFVATIVFCAFALWLAALVDVMRRKFSEPNAKLIWLLVVLFAHALGAVIYFATGRSQGSVSRQSAAT